MIKSCLKNSQLCIVHSYFLLIYRCISRKWPGNIFQVFKVVLGLVKSWVFKMLSFLFISVFTFPTVNRYAFICEKEPTKSLFIGKGKRARPSEREWLGTASRDASGNICEQLSAGLPWLRSSNCSFIPDVAEIVRFLPNLCKMQELHLSDHPWGFFLLTNLRSTLSGFT